MDTKQALGYFKALVDMAVSKGIFVTAQEVIAMDTAFRTLQKLVMDTDQKQQNSQS